MSAITHGHLLNGRIPYAQPAHGFRSGIEPVLLAASIPARTGERVLEGGTGAGAGLLCLLTRVPGVQGIGIEIDPAQADLARANARGLAEPEAMTVITGDIETVVPDGVCDHAFANPPYHAASGSVSPVRARETAKRASGDLLTVWIAALVRPLKARGSLTLIVPAQTVPTCLQAMTAAKCGADTILPLWPKAGVAAKLVVIRGLKAGRRPLRLLPGLVLHESTGRFAPEADAILRDGAPLSLDY